MKLKYLLYVILLCIWNCTTVQAGPFGLKRGMTLKNITKACGGIDPVHVKDDMWIITPKKTHPLFQHYVVAVDPDKGLYKLVLRTDKIKSNRYGTEIQQRFYEIKNRIANVYGEPVVVDTLRSSEKTFTEEDDWLYTLRMGLRTVAATWTNTDGNKLKDHIANIVLTPIASEDFTGVTLVYTFSNKEAVEKAQDDVF